MIWSGIVPDRRLLDKIREADGQTMREKRRSKENDSLDVLLNHIHFDAHSCFETPVVPETIC